MTLARAALITLLTSAAAYSQQTVPSPPRSVASKPAISSQFAKAAIKALFTLGRTKDKQLVDAAMVDLAAAQSNRAELTITHRIQLFEQIYNLHELVRQSRLRADQAEDEASLPDRIAPKDRPASIEHDEDFACIGAWIPKLRALSAHVPKQCDHREPDLKAEPHQ